VDDDGRRVWTVLWIIVRTGADQHGRHAPAVEERKFVPTRPHGAGLAAAATYLSAMRQPSRRTGARSATSLVLADGTVVDVVRSARRRKTVAAYLRDGRTVILAPDRMSATELARFAEDLHARLVTRSARSRRSDTELTARALRLSARYLGGRATPESVRWVSNQEFRWGSCTPVDRAIRLSDRMAGFPDWVVDYVLLHELAHLLEAGHGPQFRELVAAYPDAERARGYLEGWSAAQASGGASPASASPERSSGAPEPT
jgi:predicted metal-dependent hydrolase